MGENISIGDSLIITLFSISMVFLALIVISVFISMLKNLDRKDETKTHVKSKNSKPKIDKIQEKKQTEKIEETETNTDIDEKELIAVISAAVAASMGISLPQVNIKKIKRISGSSPAWSTAGRQEQIQNKL